MLSGPEDPRDTFAVRQEADALSQDGAESDFEWLARLRDHFADATALAETEARGRRQGLEEAAKAAERVRDDLYPVLTKTRYQDYEVRRFHKLSADLVVEDIRSLATTPAETREPDA